MRFQRSTASRVPKTAGPAALLFQLVQLGLSDKAVPVAAALIRVLDEDAHGDREAVAA
jgi:hypothetical protein